MKPFSLFASRVALRPVLWLSVLCALCGYSFPQDWKKAADGVEHAQVRREFGGKPVNINLLRLDLSKVRLDVHHAMDMAIGTEKTSSIAARHGAIAAINAGFFRLDTSTWAGDAAGILMIDRNLLSESSGNRSAMFVSNGKYRTTVEFERITTAGSVRIGQVEVALTGLNRERNPNDLILFMPESGRTSMTSKDGIEIVVRDGTVRSISDGNGNSPIPTDGYVVSVSGAMRTDQVRRGVRIGDKVRITERVINSAEVITPDERERVNNSGKLYEQAEDVTNGVPQLIKNGKIDITWEQEKASKSFVETRHPRTAVAKLKDGKFLMLTADGRTDTSGGLDLYDLAAYMLELGAVDAMNLDGGGSTTMFLDGKVVNQPSDKEGERKVGDAILVTLRKKKRI